MAFIREEPLACIFNLFLVYCIWWPHLPASGRETRAPSSYLTFFLWFILHSFSYPFSSCRLQTYTNPLREVVTYPDNYFRFLYFPDHCYTFGTLHNYGGQRDECLKNLKCGHLKNTWNLFLDQLQGSRAIFYKPWSLTVNILLPIIFLGSQNQIISHVGKESGGHVLQSTESRVTSEFRSGCSGLCQAGLEKSQGQRFHSLARQPLSMANYPHSELIFLLKPEPLMSRFTYMVSRLLAKHLSEEPSSIHLIASLSVMEGCH